MSRENFQHFSMSNISGRLISNNRKFKQVLMFLKIRMSFCYGEMFAILFYFQIHEKSNYLDVQNVSIRPSFGLSNIIKTKWWFKSPVYRRAIRRRFIELPGERTNILLRCVSSKIIKSYVYIFFKVFWVILIHSEIEMEKIVQNDAVVCEWKI